VPFGNYNNPTIKFNKKKLFFLSSFIQDVIFEHSNFEESIRKCKKDDFIYLDPPYMAENATSFVNYTQTKFCSNTELKLFSLVKDLDNKDVSFLMSNSKMDFLFNFFKDFSIKEVLVKRRINAKKPNSRKTELLIFNKLKKSKNYMVSNFNNSKRCFSNYRNGHKFESKVNLQSEYYIKKDVRNKGLKYEIISFHTDTIEFVHCKKS